MTRTARFGPRSPMSMLWGLKQSNMPWMSQLPSIRILLEPYELFSFVSLTIVELLQLLVFVLQSILNYNIENNFQAINFEI